MTRASDRAQQIRQEVETRQLQLDVRHTPRGVIVLPTYKNALIYLNTDEKLRKLFQYNLFFSRAEIARIPPWGGTLGDYPKAVEDGDILALKAYFIEAYRVEYVVKTLNEAVDHESNCNKYDPVKDYLTGLTWDGKTRVKSWLSDYLSVEPSEYSSFVGTMTLNAACARVDKPGIKYDYMLILEGEQDLGKSLAIEILGGSYYNQISMTERDKDTVERMQGSWIIEVAEMAMFKKRDIESLKAFITCSKDVQRLPYGHRSKTFPRRSIFLGSINPDNNGYLSDSTGNRRFLPVLCKGDIKVNELRAVRDQLWAEAWQIYKKGFPMYITKGTTVSTEALVKQAFRQTVDEWQELIGQYVEGMDRVRGIDIWTECLKGFASDFDRFRQVRVADCMTKLGWEKGVFRFDGKAANGYHRKMGTAKITDDDQTPWKD